MKYLNVNSRLFKQFISYLFSSAGVFIFSFLINIVLTKNLQPEIYGEYRYLFNVVIIGSVFLHFGMNYSISQFVAKSEKNEISNLFSSVAVFGILMISIFSIILYSSVLLNILIIDIKTLLVVIFLFSSTILANIVRNIDIGLNEIGKVSLYNFKIQLYFFILLIVVYLWGYNINSSLLLFIFSIVTAAVILRRIFQLKFNFNFNVNYLKKFIVFNLNYGMYLYIGGIFGIGISQLLSLVIGGYVGNLEYGYFALAYSFVAPFQMLNSTLGTVMYRDNVKNKNIPPKYFVIMLLLNIFAHFCFYILLTNFFDIVFSDSYSEAIKYILLLSIYGSIIGIGDILNKFLAAKAFTKTIMKISVISGISILPMFYITILFIDSIITALCFSYLLSGMIYLLCFIFVYIKQVTKN